MKKLHEVISRPFGSKFTIKGVELVLERFTIAKTIEYEEQGYTIEALMKNLQEKPTLWSTQIVYDLLDKDSKEKVGTLKEFREALDFEDVPILANAVIEAIQGAMPKQAKNVVAEDLVT